MSLKKRMFNPKFKSELVLEVLRGEKDLNTIATENEIQPNLLRNWKKEFLAKAEVVFDEKHESKLKEKLELERKEKEQYAKKVGQLTMQVDWLKKNLRKYVDQTTKINLVKSLLKSKALPTTVGAKLLDVNRTSIYYTGKAISEEELECKAIIDRLHTANPTWGARQMAHQLQDRGHQVGRKKTRRYMTEMGINPIYPKLNLSRRARNAHIFPYLLRNAVITRPNQAWSIDITYIPIKHGFLYLTAIIDWYSRCIVGWEVDDTLDTGMVIRAVKKAFKIAKPETLNSDQGSQFTSQQYINYLKEHKVKQSMDGKRRWADNILIERLFRTFKYDEAYISQYNNIKEARIAIKKFIYTYNFEKGHSSLKYQKPGKVYYPAMLLPYVA